MTAFTAAAFATVANGTAAAVVLPIAATVATSAVVVRVTVVVRVAIARGFGTTAHAVVLAVATARVTVVKEEHITPP